MSTTDGQVLGTTKIVDHGSPAQRWNLVIVPDGYRAPELAQFAADADQLVHTLFTTPPFDQLLGGINVFRVDVASNQSGADDPTPCGGTGAAAATYFDAHFCESGIRRLLVVNNATVFAVVNQQVPQHHMIFVIVNSTIYGGSGGSVAVFSKAPNAMLIALHEMGHTAFGLADEYEYYAGCSSNETGHDAYVGAEPVHPNVTASRDRASIKWRNLIQAATPVPTTSNPNCARCDTQPNPVLPGTVGVFEGARYFHCGLFRPAFDCRMRNIIAPFCAVCQSVIRQKLAPFQPAPQSPQVSARGAARGAVRGPRRGAKAATKAKAQPKVKAKSESKAKVKPTTRAKVTPRAKSKAEAKTKGKR